MRLLATVPFGMNLPGVDLAALDPAELRRLAWVGLLELMSNAPLAPPEAFSVKAAEG